MGAVLSDEMQKIHATWSAPIVGLGTTLQFTGETFKGVGELFANFFGGVFEKFIPNSESQKMQIFNFRKQVKVFRDQF